jgi:hypothetical protein
MLPTALKKVLSAEARAVLTTLYHESKARLPVWNNRALAIVNPSLAPFGLGYLGRACKLNDATGLFRLAGEVSTRRIGWTEVFAPLTSLVCDVPVPGALRVPSHLRMFVPLDRPLKEITAHWKMRTRLRVFAESCTLRGIHDEVEVSQVNRQLLEPFARARHDQEANVLPEHKVLEFARKGYLGVLTKDGESIAAHLGYTYARRGQRYWYCSRFGYPKEVFDDYHRLSDSNTVNAYWAMHQAMTTGHDVFDFGISSANPDGGLLQFKHRRSGVLSSFDCGAPLWIRLPREALDVFFWRWPVFSLERGGIVLNFGVPRDTTDEGVLTRLRPMAYRGLDVVRIHCGRPLTSLLEDLKSAFAGSGGEQRTAPMFELVEPAATGQNQ